MKLYQPWSKMAKWKKGLIVGFLVEIAFVVVLFLISLPSYRLHEGRCPGFSIGLGGGTSPCSAFGYFLEQDFKIILYLLILTPVIIGTSIFLYSKSK